ncbi:MAG: hypothetical protein U0840_01980 [Gemmataceae bacterium]
MPEELTREEIHEKLDRLVEERLAPLVQEPPVDAVYLARQRLHLSLELDPDAEEEARQLQAAQAIARHWQPDALSALGVDPHARRPMLGQSLVGLLVDRLLLPTRWLREAGQGSGWDLTQLRETFATAGAERIALRLLDLAEPCIITLIENGQVAKRRSNAWRVSRTLSPVEQEVQREVQRYSRPVVRNEAGWRVQGWPLHELDWRREILRSVIEE